MDIASILFNLIGSLWYLFPIVIIIALSKSPWGKGVIGEFFVNVMLKLCLPANDYHRINDVTLPTERGTTQIDHIVVSRYGIFVIETKNMQGWIFGSAHQKQWTQRIFKHTSKFQNPLHQNYKHTKTLESCLDIPPDSIYSVVVFVGDSTFKTPVPDNVTYPRGCVDFIKSKTRFILSEAQVRECITKIQFGRLQPSIKTNREHVAHVREVVRTKDKLKTCPRCNSAMVQRKSGRGPNAGNKFWGCSTFPKCRGTEPL